MPKALTKPNDYKTLARKIIQEFAELEIFVRNRVAKGYWNIGKYIDEHLLEHKDKPEHATGFYEQLAEDVGKDRTTLQLSVRFYRAYSFRDIPHELTWEHFRNLLTVKDDKERQSLEAKVIHSSWNSTKLREYLRVKRRLAAPADDDNPAPQLTFTRGRLNAYRIVPANKTLIHRGPLALDLGFREQYAIPDDAPKLKENDTVELVSTGGGSATHCGGKDGTLIGARKVEVSQDEVFTYKAAVEKVIDGDTLLVSFGFSLPVSVIWKLRLRGIDCPEIDTEEGKKAKRFVESSLKDCEFIVVKTYKDRTDKFDRYLADIFYLPEESDVEKAAQEGKFLNQELLSVKLAVLF